MKKKHSKVDRAAHLKKHTVGTSNEISFSVLDAEKNKLEGANKKDSLGSRSFFGYISLFTLPMRNKKPAATPTKEQGLHLSTGEFVSSESESGTFKSTFSPGSAASSETVSVSASKRDAASSAKASQAAGSAQGPKKLSLAAPPLPNVNPENEVARRKTRRRRRRIGVASLTVIIGLCFIGAGGGYLYQDYQKQMGQRTQLNDAIELISEADKTVVALDRIAAQPHSSDTLASVSEVTPLVPAAQTQLQEADRIAREVSSELREPSDKEAAHQTTEAVSARLDMIDSGMSIAEWVQRLDATKKEINEVWKGAIAGDVLVREAAALVVDTTDERVVASKAKSEEAVAQFAATLENLTELTIKYPELDLKKEINYVEKRRESVEHAIASDAAFLDRDLEEAVLQNEAYNRVDAEAAALAAHLPSDSAQPALDAFEQVIAPIQELYSTARLQAGSADAFIRDYLGTTNK